MGLPATSLSTGLATAAVLGAAALGSLTGRPEQLIAPMIGLVSIGVGWIVVRNRPRSPVGPAVAWSSGCIALVQIADTLAASAYTSEPLPFASLFKPMAVGLWPINLFGILLLLLVFPDGRPAGRRWRYVPWIYLLATVVIVCATWGARQVDGRVVDDPSAARSTVTICALALIAGCLLSAVWALTVTYRVGDGRVRAQVRWLMLAGIGIVVLLVSGWIVDALGASLDIAYVPFLVGILVLVPLAVGLAIVRHDLYDVDRLLSASATWVLTLLVSAAVFATVTMAAALVLQSRTAMGPTMAAFVTALLLLPLQRWMAGLVGKVLDRDRFVALAAVRALTVDVSAARREPEEVEQVLRIAQDDPALRLLLAAPDGGWVTVEGRPTELAEGFVLQTAAEPFARIVLGRDSARARRRIGELARAAWLPIEVCRLRLALRASLDEVTASRARLAEATVLERRRLERDLHDGAQQRLVAVGMRLRLLQRQLPEPYHAEVDTAVAELQACVDELRHVAHGVRPRQLDDGLAAALSAVREASPLPFGLVVEELPPLDETRALTAYFVVAEAVANALKHADARRIDVDVRAREGRVAVLVRDDGVGGVSVDAPLSALRDRVLSVGGMLVIDSPVGQGTTIEAVI